MNERSWRIWFYNRYGAMQSVKVQAADAAAALRIGRYHLSSPLFESQEKTRIVEIPSDHQRTEWQQRKGLL